MNKPKTKPHDAQIDRFKEAARQLEANESEAAFDEKLGKLVKHKPALEKKDGDR